ncbi:hypothetical protein CDAR_469591 [Caerostris darwini]|uniref:Uncharacterized protein n=1 Tax=Caerostris darwini TaxID=1538125 RepID=A0AAV4QUW2_9ARAC|nr:hypothetical protein CDAR_469591 [Caerostris darwini]
MRDFHLFQLHAINRRAVIWAPLCHRPWTPSRLALHLSNEGLHDGQNSSWFCNCPDTRLICATSSAPSKDGWPGPLNMHFNNNLLPIDIV